MNSGKNENTSIEAKVSRLMKATATTSLAELANILNIKPPSVSGAIKRGKIPGDWIEDVAQRFNVSSDWLLFGETKESNYRAGVAYIDHILPSGDSDFWSRVNKIKTKFTKNIDPEMAKQMFYMSVYDESMNPTLCKGDLIWVIMREQDKRLYSQAVMAIAYNGLIHIRRAHSLHSGWFFKADNKDYESEDFEYEQDDKKVELLGRVAMWMHTGTDDVTSDFAQDFFHPGLRDFE